MFGKHFGPDFGPRFGRRFGREFRHGFGGGFGGPRERVFDNGELRLVILNLLAEKPSYGYEIMKTIEERLAGGYAPSPGVVYPTLSMLEDEGFATAAAEGGKKRYAITEAGTEFLKTNQATVKAITERMAQAGRIFGRGRSPQIKRALMNLMFALRMRTNGGPLSAEQVKKIVDALDGAARVVSET